jgi:type I restriction enzyme S subunit
MKTPIRTSPQWLSERRLDCYFYQQEFIDHVKRVGAVFPSGVEAGTLFEVLDGTHDSVQTNCVPEGDYIIPFLRSQDIGSGFLHDGFGAFLHRLDHIEKCKRSQIRHNDLLLNIMASTGSACVYSSRYPAEANANRAVGILRAKDTEINLDFIYFFAAWISSSVGGRELARNLKGSIQQRLNLADIAECTLPAVHGALAKYIGDKLRQAEQLRSFAKAVQTEPEIFFSIPGLEAVHIGEFKAYWSAFSTVDSIRLDPKFYDPSHFKLYELLLPHQPVSIRELASPVGLRWTREEPEFFYLEIGELDIGSGLIAPTRLATINAPSRATTLVKPGDVLVSTVRPNRKNVGLVAEVDEPLPIVASSGFSVLRFSSLAEAAFYLFWLRSDAATMQLMRWDAGSSYPAIDDSVPFKVLVPKYADEVVREKGGRWFESFQAQILAQKQTLTAKLFVEALIEGKVTEAELIAAQGGLERGDDKADRCLLGRLTRRGIDVANQPPLFPDLDALYALLAKTKEARQ